MPAKSKKQQAFMAMELERKRSGKRTLTDISEEGLEHYASTKTKDLPKKVKHSKASKASY